MTHDIPLHIEENVITHVRLTYKILSNNRPQFAFPSSLVLRSCKLSKVLQPLPVQTYAGRPHRAYSSVSPFLESAIDVTRFNAKVGDVKKRFLTITTACLAQACFQTCATVKFYVYLPNENEKKTYPRSDRDFS